MSYYCFLEEYYLGRLHLGKFSGPDDLGLALTLCCFVSAYYGSEELWSKEYDIFGRGNLRTSHLATYLVIIFNVASTLQSVVTNLYEARNSEHF